MPTPTPRSAAAPGGPGGSLAMFTAAGPTGPLSGSAPTPGGRSEEPFELRYCVALPIITTAEPSRCVWPRFPNVAVLGRTVGPDPAWVDLARHPGAEQAPGVEVVRVEASLFFANADHVRARIRRIAESANPHAVVLDAETTPSIDLTGAQMVADLADNLRGRGTRLLVARDVGQVRDVLQQAEVPDIMVAPARLRSGHSVDASASASAAISATAMVKPRASVIFVAADSTRGAPVIGATATRTS
jgi:anti-anti-sigma regulatory factor